MTDAERIVLAGKIAHELYAQFEYGEGTWETAGGWLKQFYLKMGDIAVMVMEQENERR